MITFKLYRTIPSIFVGIVCRSNTNISYKVLTAEACRQFNIYQPSVNYKQNLYPSYFQTHRFMAGHAKWQNVKHVKAAKDKQKSLLFNKYVRLINSAIREKGPDPKANNRLALVLEDAKKFNVPSSVTEGALKRASSKKMQCGTVEMLGPGGCIVVLEYETDSVSEMRRMLKIICRKYSVGIFPGGGGRWRSAYEQKGILRITKQLNGEAFDSEKMLDAAIEAGAEDVQKLEDDDDSILYEFYCAPDDLNMVKKELEKTFMVEEAYVGYIPINTAKLSDTDKTEASNFLNELGDMPDVIRLYENVE